MIVFELVESLLQVYGSLVNCPGNGTVPSGPLDNTLLIKGAVPGHQNSILSINRSQKKEFKSLDEKKEYVVRKVNPMKQSKTKAKGKG